MSSYNDAQEIIGISTSPSFHVLSDLSQTEYLVKIHGRTLPVESKFDDAFVISNELFSMSILCSEIK